MDGRICGLEVDSEGRMAGEKLVAVTRSGEEGLTKGDM